MTVILPARDCQTELDLTLAALSEQSYPADLMDVVVVDDSSHPPLELPAIRPQRTRILRLDETGAHGSGRARAEGAREATGDVLLFLDADMIAQREHVEAHTRWHHALADAVVLGAKEFVNVDGIDALKVRDAVRDGALDDLFASRDRSDHTWLDRLIDRTDSLVEAGEELFTAVVGASLSVRQSLYLECGGFAAFDRRGIVDTEFGYRAVTAGAVVVPEPEARSIHQGQRTFATRGEEVKRLRAGLAANHLPTKIFRPPARGRVWTVPSVRVLIHCAGSTYETLAVTVDAVLASGLDDLVITLNGDIDALSSQLLEDYFGADPRVILTPDNIDTGFPSPYTAIVPPDAVLGPDTLSVLVGRLSDSRVGVVRTVAAAGEVQVWRTAALHRARRYASTTGSDLLDASSRLFGVEVVDARSVTVTLAMPLTNRTGMVYDATLAALVEAPRLRRSVVGRLTSRALRAAARVMPGPAASPTRARGRRSP